MIRSFTPEIRLKEEGWSFLARFMVFVIPSVLVVALWLFQNANMSKQHNLNDYKRMDIFPASSSSPFQERIILNASDLVSWNTYLGQCEPNICNGARLDTLIPLISLPTALLHDLDGPWYDAERVRQCFQNKHIVLVGDSTLQETNFDLYHLLAGLHRKHNYAIPNGTETITPILAINTRIHILITHPFHAGEEEIHHSESMRKKISIKVSEDDPTVLLDLVGTICTGCQDQYPPNLSRSSINHIRSSFPYLRFSHSTRCSR